MKGSAWGLQFFSFWEGPWGGIFGFFSLFPLCSQFVPMRSPKGRPSSQVVPQHILNSTSALSHMVCPKFNSPVYKLSIFVSILQLMMQRGASIGECPMFQKNWWWANQYGPFRKPKKKLWAHQWTHRIFLNIHYFSSQYFLIWKKYFSKISTFLEKI
jgi:hypothetical protein